MRKPACNWRGKLTNQRSATPFCKWPRLGESSRGTRAAIGSRPQVDGPKPPAAAPAGYRARCDFRLAILPSLAVTMAVAVALVWVIRPAARMNQTASVFVLLVERRRSTACRTGPNFIGGVLTSAWHSRPAQQIPIRKGCLSRWRKRGSSLRATPRNG
jgi:hypothetical protein